MAKIILENYIGDTKLLDYWILALSKAVLIWSDVPNGNFVFGYFPGKQEILELSSTQTKLITLHLAWAVFLVILDPALKNDFMSLHYEGICILGLSLEFYIRSLRVLTSYN